MKLNCEVLVKSVIYRLFASCITMCIAYCCTGSLTISGIIGIVEFIGKVISFYVFETTYNFIRSILTANTYRQTCFKLNKKKQRCIWLSGLNCAGKTTIAKELSKVIPNSIILDGDAIRNGINFDLGFTKHDIRVNLQKIANLANILLDQGYNVIVACISKNKSDREFVKDIIGKNFNEVYVYCNDSDLKTRLNIHHKNTKIIQTNYEKSDYDVIEVNTSVYSPSKCVKRILCSIQKV